MDLRISQLLLFFLPFLIYAQDESSGLKTIKSADLLKTVNYLTSRELNGRLPGNEGYNKAADYVAEKFAALKLKAPINDSYFQYFDVEYNEILAPCHLKKVNISTPDKKYKLGRDFVCRGFTGKGNINADIVFCGYGQSMPEAGYDDYANVYVKGKVVMIFKKNPVWKLGDKPWKYTTIRDKVGLAKRKGAVAVLFVSRPNQEHPQPIIGSVMAGDTIHLGNIPQLHITVSTANEFLKSSNTSLLRLQTAIDMNKKPSSLKTDQQCIIGVYTNYVEKAKTMNVIGIYEGVDEKLKDEYIILGAHLDHVGGQSGEIYFPGANDNASGSSAVLEIAEAFVKGKIKTKRSVIFVLFACEEHGLDGSTYCANHLPVPAENVVAMLNLDCIAYGDSIRIGCGKSYPKLYEIVKEQDEKHINMMVDATWEGGGADATPFFKIGVPTQYFVTTNSYDHLHMTTDLPSTLNLELFEKITKLAYLTTYAIAMGDYQREKPDSSDKD